MPDFKPYRMEFEAIAGFCSGEVAYIDLAHAADETVVRHEQVHKHIFQNTPDGLLQLLLRSRLRISADGSDEEAASAVLDFLIEDTRTAHERAATYLGIVSGPRSEIYESLASLNDQYRDYFLFIESALCRYTNSWYLKEAISVSVMDWAFSSIRINTLDREDWANIDIYKNIAGPTERLEMWRNSCLNGSFFDELDMIWSEVKFGTFSKPISSFLDDEEVDCISAHNLESGTFTSGRDILRNEVCPYIPEAIMYCVKLPTIVQMGVTAHSRTNTWRWEYERGKDRFRSQKVSEVDSDTDVVSSITQLGKIADFGIAPQDRLKYRRYTRSRLEHKLGRLRNLPFIVCIVQGGDSRLAVYGIILSHDERPLESAFRLLSESSDFSEIMETISRHHEVNKSVYCVIVFEHISNTPNILRRANNELEEKLEIPDTNRFKIVKYQDQAISILSDKFDHLDDKSGDGFIPCLLGEIFSPKELIEKLSEFVGVFGIGDINLDVSKIGGKSGVAVYLGVDIDGGIFVSLNIPKTINYVLGFVENRIEDGYIVKLEVDMGDVLSAITFCCIDDLSKF